MFKEYYISGPVLQSFRREETVDDARFMVEEELGKTKYVSSVTKVHYSKTQRVIYHEKDRANYVYFIKKGMIKYLRLMPNGRARILRLLGPQHFFGLEGIFFDVYDHTVAAVDAVELLRVPSAVMLECCHDRPHLSSYIQKEWRDQLKIADTWIAEFSTGAIKVRVARLLNYLATLNPSSHDGWLKLLSCEEFAAVLGVTAESVSRILADFKRRKLLGEISSLGGNIYRSDQVALHKIGRDSI